MTPNCVFLMVMMGKVFFLAIFNITFWRSKNYENPFQRLVYMKMTIYKKPDEKASIDGMGTGFRLF